MKSNSIGELNEQPLHAALKSHYAGEVDRQEVRMGAFVVDVFRDEECIEIQTGNFSAIKAKLSKLVRNNRIRLIFPIVIEKWLLKIPARDGEGAVRRKSPKKETIYQLFDELVSFPKLILEDNFTLECVEVVAEEVRKHISNRAWRTHGWVPVERRLLEVRQSYQFPDEHALDTLLPAELPDLFTSEDLAEYAGISKRLSQKAIYCYRKMGTIRLVGKQGRFNLYQRILRDYGNAI